MSCYLTEPLARSALRRMQNFYSELESLYIRHDLVVNEDMGRRNILMSSLQEKYFALALNEVYPGTYANGKTGEPDIMIPILDRELECKLTSRNRSGSWALQCDYNTLRRKGALDHLYVLASDDFTSFAVLFFEGLTIDDFHTPSPGSKGKARLRWTSALSKCTTVIGETNDKSKQFLFDANRTLENPASTAGAKSQAAARIDYWNSRTNISFCLEQI